MDWHQWAGPALTSTTDRKGHDAEAGGCLWLKGKVACVTEAPNTAQTPATGSNTSDGRQRRKELQLTSHGSRPGHVPALWETLTQENAGGHFHVEVIKRPYLTQSSCSNVYFLLSTLSFLPRVKPAAAHGKPTLFLQRLVNLRLISKQSHRALLPGRFINADMLSGKRVLRCVIRNPEAAWTADPRNRGQSPEWPRFHLSCPHTHPGHVEGREPEHGGGDGVWGQG